MAFRFNPLSGNFDIVETGSGSFAPISSEYVLLSADATLANERVLTAGSGIDITDGGAGGNVTIALTTPQQEIPNRHFVMALMGA